MSQSRDFWCNPRMRRRAFLTGLVASAVSAGLSVPPGMRQLLEEAPEPEWLSGQFWYDWNADGWHRVISVVETKNGELVRRETQFVGQAMITDSEHSDLYDLEGINEH